MNTEATTGPDPTAEADTLAAALEREHQQIDVGIAEFADSGAREPLTRAVTALRRHIFLEEEFLFPLLGEADPALTAPVFVMLREHAQMWQTLETLERDLAAGGTGAGALKELTVQLLHHNMKEEKILYPRAEAVLPPAANERLRDLLERDGGLPEGWVCFKAR